MRFIIALFLLLGCSVGRSQEGLSLEQVLQLALEQNDDIEIAKQRTLIEGQKVFRSNVGLTPTVRLFANGEYSQTNMVLELNNFGAGSTETTRITEDLAYAMTHNLGIRAEYTLIDAGKRKFQLQQLQNLADRSKLQEKSTVDQTLYQVSQLYLMLSSLEQTRNLLNENILLSEERLRRAEVENKYAKANQLAVLRATTDLNSDRISLRNTQRDIDNTQRDLFRLLKIKEETPFSTVPLTTPKVLPDFATLKNLALQRNPNILLANQGILIEEQQLQIDMTANKPDISVYGGPSLLRQDFEVNQIKSSQTIGPTVGFSMNYTIADGKKRKRNQDIQRMQIRLSQQEQKWTINNVLMDLEKSWNDYQSLQDQLVFEQANLPFYEENLRQSQINYKAGKLTDTDLRTAQLNLLSAQISINKIEIELQQEYYTLLNHAGLITTF